MQAITIGARKIVDVKYIIFSFFDTRLGIRTSHSIVFHKIWASFRWDEIERNTKVTSLITIDDTNHLQY